MISFTYPKMHVAGSIPLLEMGEVSGPASLPVFGVELSEDDIEPIEIGTLGSVFGQYITEISVCPQRYDDTRGVWWPLIIRDRLVGEMRRLGARHAVYVTIAGDHVVSMMHRLDAE